MQHPAALSVLTAGTACPRPHPRTLKGNSKNFLGACRRAEEEEQCPLPLSPFQAKSNCLRVASEAQIARPWHTCRQREHPGGYELWADAELGGSTSPTTLPGAAAGTWGTAREGAAATTAELGG